MTDWMDGSVEVPGARLGFSRRGLGSSGVVALHGQLGDRSVVRPLVDTVEGRTVVTPDLRGRGGSVCRDVELHTWERYAADIEALLDNLELSAAVLAGVSLGAGLAIATALAYPERVDGLVLWASPYRGREKAWSDEQRAIQHPVIETATRMLDEGNGVLTSVDNATARRWGRHDPKSIGAALVGLGWSQPFGEINDLKAISAPTLVIPGSDALHTPEIAEDYIHALPRASLGREIPSVVADFIATL